VRIALLLLCLSLLVAVPAAATHIRAADLKVEPLCDRPFTYRITVVAYLNTLSNTRFGTSSEIHFGDGFSVRIPVSSSVLRPDLGNNIAVATFVTHHAYTGPGTYIVTYMERDRSTGVLNIQRSEDVPYVTNVTIDISTKFGCNNYPVLSVPPIDRACHASTFYHTSGAYDVDGDSLSYELAIPLSSPSTPAPYTAPTDNRYYNEPSKGNEAKSGPPAFRINQLDGLLTWDAPGMVGEYNIAFRIIEWRKDEATGKYDRISITTRDMQIIVEDCQNIRPYLKISNDTCVVAGNPVIAIARGFDDDKHDVKIEVYSELIDLPAAKGPADYTPRPPAFVSSVPFALAQLSWSTSCQHIRQQPYQVVFKITDNPPKGPKLVNFEVWNVRVIGPPPTQAPPLLDLVKRSADITWDPYSCENASKMQVWRKVGSYAVPTNYCDIRSPGYWGYKLIAELPPGSTSFNDNNFGKGLSVGALYCYRIVAGFNDTRSLLSQEFCVGPIQADAPVITHVSVEKTASQGNVRISWRKPFNINKDQFPEPYDFEVYRADDFIGETNISVAGKTRDTTFLDPGINTEEKVFNYRIVLYATPKNATVVVPVDTSAVASSVRLSAKPGEGLIELAWRDSVPWSNVVDTNPWHRIYRGADNDSPASMLLIDSVNVTVEGFRYTDRGRYKSQPIEEDVYYSYRVLTRGTYGNPNIKLLENFSQVVSSYPENDLLPCSPNMQVAIVDCEQYVVTDNCGQTEFSNQIFWSSLGLKGCRKDIKYYNVYGSSSRDGEYGLLATNVVDTFYVDSKLPSFARCYRVSAVDRLGVEGALSDSVCNDNCPSYMLPNVFSPNDDGHNDTFHARFKPGSVLGETTCPRFVIGLDLRVYDRWGKQVYRRRMDSEETAMEFEWDGRDEKGSELPAGVYFYSADVSFDMLDEDGRVKEVKGWVQVVR
jgi:gliding motility-associated-like protein